MKINDISNFFLTSTTLSYHVPSISTPPVLMKEQGCADLKMINNDKKLLKEHRGNDIQIYKSTKKTTLKQNSIKKIEFSVRFHK